MLDPWKKHCDKPRQHIKKQRHYFADKGLYKAIAFLVVMYGCESWIIKNTEHWRTDAFELVLQNTLESLLDCKEIKPVHPKGNQSWVFIGRTNAEAKALILWPPDIKSKFIRKDPGMLGQIEGRRWRGWQRVRWLEDIIDSMDMSLSKLWEIVKDEETWHGASMGFQRVRHDWVIEQQQWP